MKKEICLASNNEGKLLEFRDILSPLGYVVYSPKDLNIDFDPIEDGKDYRENAYIKAKDLFEKVKFDVISDDSGLEIKDLGNFPGLHTARYLKEQGSLKAVLEDLDRRLPKDSKREATFHCCLCLLEKGKDKPLYFEGECPGYLLKEEKGENGFGYDPIFHSYEKDLDFGTARKGEKHRVSHRGKALYRLAFYLSI